MPKDSRDMLSEHEPFRKAILKAVDILFQDSEVFELTLDKHLPSQFRSQTLASMDEKCTQGEMRVKQLDPQERKMYLAKCKEIREKLRSTEGSNFSKKERMKLINQYQRMKKMIRDSSAVQIQAAWRGYQIRRPVLSARDPSHSRLMLAKETIRKERDSYNRPEDINLMTVEQLHDDKAFLKRLLNGLDKAFKHKNGRLPTKQEKEVYRPIYEEYRAIKDNISSATLRNQQKNTSITLAQIKAEKRILQIRLNKFERQFRMKHGRKIQYQRDIVPVKGEFDRYLQLKTQILQYACSDGSSSSNNNNVTATTTQSTEFPISTDNTSNGEGNRNSSTKSQNPAVLNGFVSPTARSISTSSSPRISSSSFVERSAGAGGVSRNLISPLKHSRDEVHSPPISPTSKELDKEAIVMHEWEPRNRTDMQLDNEVKR